MTTERAALYRRLAEVLGPDQAATLMSYLPFDEPASKADLRSLEERLESRFTSIDQRFTTIDMRFDNLHEALRLQTRSFILASMGTMVALAALAFAAAAVV